MISRPYHNPLSPSQDLLTGLINVRVVWPSAPRFFHIPGKLYQSVLSLVLCTHYRTGTVFLLRFGKRYAYTSKIFWTNFQIIQKFQIFRIQNSNKIDVFNIGRCKKKRFYTKSNVRPGGETPVATYVYGELYFWTFNGTVPEMYALLDFQREVQGLCTHSKM